LVETIKFERPDLVCDTKGARSVLIPLNPDLSYFNGIHVSNYYYYSKLLLARNVPDVGELMCASYPQYFDSNSTDDPLPVPSDPDTFSRAVLITHPWYLFFVSFYLIMLTIIVRWLGEKYDGIRACWNIVEKVLYSLLHPLCDNTFLILKRFSRAGYPLRLLPSFIGIFPRQFLDSEIWYD
jgi:hypothetical protein